jgi:pimeloyl-ACP methyl ester carboxylesterase
VGYVGFAINLASALIAHLSVGDGPCHTLGEPVFGPLTSNSLTTYPGRIFFAIAQIATTATAWPEALTPPSGAPVTPILPPQDGYPFLDKAKFLAAFAGDVSPDAASFMADSQVPWRVEALGGAITQPACRTKPSWYLVSTDDKMIPPDAQRAMSRRAGPTVVEVKGSHAVYVSQPQAVAHLIEQAATAVLAAGHEKAQQVYWPT